MPVADRTAAEAAIQIADALEAAGLPHAIGGALALARTTSASDDGTTS